MADFIDNQILISNKIIEIFKTNRPELIGIKKTFKKDFESILRLFSEEFKLESEKETSVNSIKYFSTKSRVKTSNSLKEKLIRKNLVLSICKKLSLNNENFEENHDNVKKSLFLVDDIIGIRIVTELKTDCFKAYDLIKEKKAYFKDKGIVFIEKELMNQPETMKNGLPIFRIKGTYKENYAFELQIKSKIDEAWGDMDHSIFYKDYSISPIKSTVQVTMNNVGELLDKIEGLLLGLRDSEKHYQKKEEDIKFLKELSDEVFEKIKSKLGDNYELGKIATILKFLKKKTKLKSKTLKLKNIDYNFLNFTVQDEFFNNYLVHRNSNFEMLIIEALYFSWKGVADNTFKLDNDNYQNELKKYIQDLSENNFHSINVLLENKEKGLSKSFTSDVLYKYSNVVTKDSVFISAKTNFELYLIYTNIKDALNEHSLEPFDAKSREEFALFISEIYSKCYLHFEELLKIDLIPEKFSKYLELHPLEPLIIEINEFIEKRINNYANDKNIKKSNEISFMNILTTDVINKLRNN